MFKGLGKGKGKLMRKRKSIRLVFMHVHRDVHALRRHVPLAFLTMLDLFLLLCKARYRVQIGSYLTMLIVFW